jgi:hypothetical protein
VPVTADQRNTACQAVVDAYGGELAAGHTWPCLQRLREALCRHVLDAYRHLAATRPTQTADSFSAPACQPGSRLSLRICLSKARAGTMRRSVLMRPARWPAV